jgi:haloalkane dehalogenase
MSNVVRTPDDRFSDLPDYPFEPRYAVIEDPVYGELRMHYVDAGPRDAAPVLLLHGQPTWSYLYRKVIPALVERGHRAIAPDYIGFGRSDKINDRFAYTLDSHIGWLSSLIRQLDLQDITGMFQDWGGPIGFGVLCRDGDRFARVVASDTALHTCDAELKDRLEWAAWAVDDNRVVLEEAFVDWMFLTQHERDFRPGAIVGALAAGGMSNEVANAYDAPFPDETYRAGLRQFNCLIPLTRNTPGAIVDRASMVNLRNWVRPFLTVWAAEDVATRGWDTIFQQEVPGAAGMPHAVVEGAGHFIQEDQGAELGRIISDFIAGTA